MLAVLFILLAVLSGQWTDSVLEQNGAHRATFISSCDDLFWGGAETLSSANQTVADGEMFVFVNCTTIPCADLFDTAQVLFCCRSSKYFFKPLSTSRRHVFVTMLLLMSGIEPNPGPSSTSTPLNMGVINTRSMVNKSAFIHDYDQ